MPHIDVTFGALPIGAPFTVVAKHRDLRDRRHYVWVTIPFIKNSHGTEAGFARRADISGLASDRRFVHGFHVQIDTDDLRLVLACAANADTWQKAAL